MIKHAVLAGLLVSCGKPTEPTPAPAAAPTSLPSRPAAESPLLSAEDDRATLAALQGRWLVPGRVTDDPSKPSPMGLNTVWEIDGDKLVTWDGLAEESRRLELVAPCLLRIVEKKSSVRESFSYASLVIAGEVFFTEDAAVRRGDAIVGCRDSLGKAYLLRGDACRVWEQPRARPGKGDEATCKVDGETLVIIDGEFTWRLPIVAPGAVVPGANAARRIASRDAAIAPPPAEPPAAPPPPK